MTRTFLIALVVCLIAIPLAAQDLAPTRFFIERIEIREADRVSPEVVVAESRLSAGEEYSEADLRDASARLSRLPFLLSAEFSLEKGSERGRHVLVITINETKNFFYALDLRPIIKRDENVRADYSDRIGVADNVATVGMRWFMGRRGALHMALLTTDYDNNFARDYIAFAIGYTQYDLLDTRAFATLNLKHVVTSANSTLSPQLVVGIPVSANQTVTLDIDEVRFGEDVRQLFEVTFDENRSQRVASLTWSYNTTNRPFLPTRGTLLSVQPRVSWSDAATYTFIVTPDPNGGSPVFETRPDTLHSEAREVVLKAARYVELSERTSVSAGVETSLVQYTLESDVDGVQRDRAARAAVTAGYSYSLWDANRAKNGDSRIELNARVGSRSVADFYPVNADQRQFSASWVRRSAWGTLRFGVGFAW
ncbi:MAG TPA: hypothetical protein VGQ76_17210 [Thermoanaerobaculia bacterium]|nr:hypothetical protein [Thermoanaerobaculia bacterium]